MRRLGAAVSSEGRVYFTDGVSAVLMGWREMTIDVDLKAEPEPQGFFECLPRLKDDLDINIELASPDQFVPLFPAGRIAAGSSPGMGGWIFITTTSTGRRCRRWNVITLATGTTWPA